LLFYVENLLFYVLFGAKMLIDAQITAQIEIQDGGRPPSWIFQNLISDQWGSLGG